MKQPRYSVTATRINNLNPTFKKRGMNIRLSGEHLFLICHDTGENRHYTKCRVTKLDGSHIQIEGMEEIGEKLFWNTIFLTLDDV